MHMLRELRRGAAPTLNFEQPRHVGHAQVGKHHALIVRATLQRLESTREGSMFTARQHARRDQEQHPALRQRARVVRQESQRSLVGPVQILQQEDAWPLPRERSERASELLEDAKAPLGWLIQERGESRISAAAEPGEHIGSERSTTRAQRLVGFLQANLQQLNPGPKRRQRAVAFRLSLAGPHAAGAGAVEQLAREAALADARGPE